MWGGPTSYTTGKVTTWINIMPGFWVMCKQQGTLIQWVKGMSSVDGMGGLAKNRNWVKASFKYLYNWRIVQNNITYYFPQGIIHLSLFFFFWGPVNLRRVPYNQLHLSLIFFQLLYCVLILHIISLFIFLVSTPLQYSYNQLQIYFFILLKKLIQILTKSLH